MLGTSTQQVRGSTPVSRRGSFDGLPTDRVVPKACGTPTGLPVLLREGDWGLWTSSYSRSGDGYCVKSQELLDSPNGSLVTGAIPLA